MNETSGSPKKINVLLVDDRLDGLLALEALLASPDLNLVKAASGQEALARLASNEFSVILLDVQMPGMDGFETARIIRHTDWCRETPIIFVTAISMEKSHVFQGYECGAVDYLFKPLDPFILKNKVSVFVELYRKNLRIQEHTTRLRELTQRLVNTNEALRTEMSERKRAEKEMLAISNREQIRIGRDLHDGLCQELAGLAFMIDAIQKNSPEELKPKMLKLSEFVRKTITDTTSLAKGLNPISLEHNGLIPAFQELSSNTSKLFSVQCRFHNDPMIWIDDPIVTLNLYRIAQEAIHNSVRHGKATEIDLTLVREGSDQMKMSIQDNGIGFSGDPNGAAGMGLKNMRLRAKLIDGVFRVGSQPNKGTLVECVFDAPKTENHHSIEVSKEMDAPSLQLNRSDNGDRKRVLLVEDHPVMRRWVTEMISAESDLEICGETDDASEALKMIQTLQPDIALIDISLKDSSGIDLVRKIAAQFNNLPTLVISMYDERVYAEKALIAGAKGYTIKDDTAEHIVTAIRKILNGELYVSGRYGRAIVESFRQREHAAHFERAVS